MPQVNLLTTEQAYILFADIVGYSLQSMNWQIAQVNNLRRIVEATTPFRNARESGKLVSLDKGDGVALVFFDHPDSPLRCAVEISQALRQTPELDVRMGLNSGLVSRSQDITDKANVYGDGINLAQRVMDCGSARHILLSDSLACLLQNLEEWRPCLTDIGDYTVKHDSHLRLYNFYNPEIEIGNPMRPSGSAGHPANWFARLLQKLFPSASHRRRETSASAVAASTARESALSFPECKAEPVSSEDKQPVAQRFRLSSPVAPTASMLKKREDAGTGPEAKAESSIARKRIALIYKRNAQPDNDLLNLLEIELKSRGFDIFIDRHLTIGVEWAQAIEREVRTADAVIPLISESALRSEMLEYELQTANKASQISSEGKPRILPIRIRFDGPLPDSLAAILDPLQYTLWQDDADNARLLEEIVHALENPPVPQKLPDREAIGGAVPLDSHFYIARSADKAFYEAIARRDSIVLVKGARQMGKTSLLARGLQQAREVEQSEEKARVVLTDFQTLSEAQLQTPDAFFKALCYSLKRQLNLDVSVKDVWDDDLGPVGCMESFLLDVVMPGIKAPIVWGLDEVDRLFTCSFGSEVFGLFRSWHNRRALDPAGPWARLTLAIAYATEAHLFITDLNQSPFNVGTRLALDDFNFDQVAELNRRYGEPLISGEEQERFMELFGGHPYLVRRGLDAIANEEMTLSQLEAEADREEGPFGDHLRRILVLLSEDEALLNAMRDILREQPCPTEKAFYRLRSAGVMRGDSLEELKIRCQLYARYLSRHLLR